MTLPKVNDKKWHAIFSYGSVILVTTLILLFLTQFHTADWNIPFYAGGDADDQLVKVKGLLEGEWNVFSNIANSHLAAPFGLVLGDSLSMHNSYFSIIKGLSFFTNNYATVFNLYILFTFLITPVLFMAALRHINISYTIALPLSILFSFLPFHFNRMSGHIWIASYYFVPLLAVILAVLPSKIPPFFLQQKKKLQISFFNKQSLFVVLSLFLAGLGEAYFMFFFCFLCIIAGIYAYYKNNRSGYHLVSALIILGIAIASTLINILPQLLYQSEHGENPLIAPRYPIESEIVGLKLTNLVLPSNNHRSQTARIIKQAYQPFPQKVEGDGESLGIIGLIGFLFLLSLPLFAKKEEEENINNRLSIFTIASILFATVGGGSAIFALFITPTIRSHNRISIFIACFAFFALASLLQQYKSKMPKPLLYTILGIILTIGIWDQTNSSARITQPHKTEYLSDKAFISQIESSVPEASSIFQLPFAPYIGSPVIHKMNDYSHFKGYLHSKNLNWSYGAVRGRPQGNWYQSTANMPIQKIIPTLRNAGFSGIYIDRFGYPDNGTQIEKTLQQQLQTSPITSSNNRLSFWKL